MKTDTTCEKLNKKKDYTDSVCRISAITKW